MYMYCPLNQSQSLKAVDPVLSDVHVLPIEPISIIEGRWPFSIGRTCIVHWTKLNQWRPLTLFYRTYVYCPFNQSQSLKVVDPVLEISDVHVLPIEPIIIIEGRWPCYIGRTCIAHWTNHNHWRPLTLLYRTYMYCPLNQSQSLKAVDPVISDVHVLPIEPISIIEGRWPCYIGRTCIAHWTNLNHWRPLTLLYRTYMYCPLNQSQSLKAVDPVLEISDVHVLPIEPISIIEGRWPCYIGGTCIARWTNVNHWRPLTLLYRTYMYCPLNQCQSLKAVDPVLSDVHVLPIEPMSIIEGRWPCYIGRTCIAHCTNLNHWRPLTLFLRYFCVTIHQFLL